MKNECIIIGGGISGLFTGALLAKEGYRITVLEKNRNAGGGMQMFGRNGTMFETGIHIIGGFRGSSLEKILGYLGIRDRISISESDNDIGYSIYIASDDTTYNIPLGREEITRYFISLFPAEAGNIRTYMDSIFGMAGKVPLLHLESENFMPEGDDLLPYNEFIGRHIGNGKLRNLLGFLNLFSGAVADRTPAYIHSIVNALYMSGASMLGEEQVSITESLCSVITENGGSVETGHRVTEVCIDENTVSCVRTDDGKEWTADTYISSIHPSALLDISRGMVLRKSTKARLERMENSCSAFCVFVRLKENTFPYISHCNFIYDGYCNIIYPFSGNDTGLSTNIMYMTPPSSGRGEYADRLIALSPMKFDAVQEWEDTSIGRRGEKYGRWKMMRAKEIIDRIIEVQPELKDCIGDYFAGSPLTIRDYLGSVKGSIYGLSKVCSDIGTLYLSPKTKCDNLFLTGQNVFMHGLCGASLSAVMTAEQITGGKDITDKIKSENGY